ncbi:hypothetical protein [Photobacterium rosenbergii]|uniref:Uncharacterized protein n=1 Tax=Photobacterium rosenbergii TaxID=294936 RepID=A0ABU3ZI80_9GAMM|nr:hypothetical protein [Photobacterium rosenbergii]MDV5169787.1 hypothetical protein [Photobacterium rosenbergii]
MARNISKSLNNVLLICETSTNVEGFIRLFNSCDFYVDVRHDNLQDVDFGQYGAVAHITNSSDSLTALLGHRLESVKDEEWILISGDNDDLHCTVQVTALASEELRLYIRTLWAKFNIA